MHEVTVSAGDINVHDIARDSGYQDFLESRISDSVAFAKVLSKLPKLRAICFGDGFRGSCDAARSTQLREVGLRFIQIISPTEHLGIPNLKLLTFKSLEIRTQDEAAIVGSVSISKDKLH